MGWWHQARAAATLWLLALSLVASGCIFRRPYAYVDSPEFDGQRWGTPVTQFDHLEFLGFEGLEAVSCGLPSRVQISDYRKSPKTFQYPGATTTSVEHVFCYEGTIPHLCGASIDFESQEFELADHHNPSDGRTNYERIRDALVKQHGRPHRGRLPDSKVKILYGDDLFLVPQNQAVQRYSWCGPGDPHAPKDCKTSIVLTFDPLLGHGFVLYATPELRKLTAEHQRFDPFFNRDYEQLFEFAKPEKLALPIACDARTAKTTKPFEHGSDTDRSSAFSEITRDAVVVQRGDPPLAEPSRGLATDDMAQEVTEARQKLDQYRRDGQMQAYWCGYMLGLAHLYYQGSDDTEEAYEKWLNAINATHDYVVWFGIGYQNGLNKAHERAPSPVQK